MRSLPLLALIGLGLLLTACVPAAGSSFTFTGLYSGPLQTTTLTITLTQTGMTITGSSTASPSSTVLGSSGTIAAMVGASGAATGTLTPTAPAPAPPPLSVHFFLTTMGDLVVRFPSFGNVTFVLERQ